MEYPIKEKETTRPLRSCQKTRKEEKKRKEGKQLIAANVLHMFKDNIPRR